MLDFLLTRYGNSERRGLPSCLMSSLPHARRNLALNLVAVPRMAAPWLAEGCEHAFAGYAGEIHRMARNLGETVVDDSTSSGT